MATYRVENFTGGVTDLYLDGNPSQGKRFDNWLLHLDGFAYGRPGSAIFSNLGDGLGPSTRINAVMNFNNNADLFYVQQKALYTGTTAATLAALAGPTGHNFFSLGSTSPPVSWSEWKTQLFATNASQPNLMKVYKASGGAYAALQVGLPEVQKSANNISDATLLTNGIALANELRTRLLAHMNDQGTINPNLHKALDPARATLAAVAVASDQATLFTLVGALLTAYNAHVKDTLPYAIVGTTGPVYHYSNYYLTLNSSNINLVSKYSSTPTTLKDAALMLDDLRQKYYWHTWATFTHGNALHTSTDYFAGQYGANAVAVAAIGTVSDRPIVTADLTETTNFANQFKSYYNTHVANTTLHVAADPNVVSAANASDETTLYNLIHHLKVMSYLHAIDVPQTNPSGGGLVAQTYMVGTVTVGAAGATTLTSWAATYVSYDPAIGTLVIPSAAIPGWATKNVKVTNYAAGTITVDTATTGAAGSGKKVQLVQTTYHYGTRAFPGGTSSVLTADTFSLGGDLTGWNEQLWTTAKAYTSHLNSDDVDTTLEGSFQRFYSYHAASLSGIANLYITLPKPQVMTVSYAFHYKNSYTDSNGILFEDDGPTYVSSSIQTNAPCPTSQKYPTYPANYLTNYSISKLSDPTQGLTVSVTNPYLAAVSSVAISNLPTLSNGSTANYDTTNTKIAIFRTLDAGAEYHHLTDLANGTGTYSDTANDTLTASAEITALADADLIYTSGGVADFDPPLAGKAIYILNGVGYLGNINDSAHSETFPKRVQQSIPGNPNAWPGDFFDDMDSDVVAISAVRDLPVVLCSRHIQRLEGQISLTGQGALSHVSISDTVGCVAPASVVKIEGGLLYFGTDGVYFTDAYQNIKISDHLNTTYATIVATTTQCNHVCGAYDPTNQRVYWSVQRSSASTDNDAFLVLDLNFKVKPQSSFTFLAGPWAPVGVAVISGQVVFSDKNGYLFSFQDALLTDPVINTGTATSTWLTQRIVNDYISCSTSGGDPTHKKWATELTITAKGGTDLSLQINSIDDDFRRTTALTPVRYRNNYAVGTTDFVVGDKQIRFDYAGGQGTVTTTRKFKRGSFRFGQKQIQVTNAKTAKYNSDMRGVATLDHFAKTLTLNNASYTWATDIVGDVVTFEYDNYHNEFTVATRNSATKITLTDATGILPPSNTAIKWTVRGYKKDERPVLVDLAFSYNPFSSSVTDANAGNPA